MEKAEKSRREFLVTGLLAGMAAGCSGKDPFTGGAEQGTVPSGDREQCLPGKKSSYFPLTGRSLK